MTTIRLTKEQTRAFEERNYAYFEKDEILIVKQDNEFLVFKLFKDWDNIELNCDSESKKKGWTENES